jgi:hypothetical protein
MLLLLHGRFLYEIKDKKYRVSAAENSASGV